MVIDAKEAFQVIDPDLDIELEGSVLPPPSLGACQGLGFIDPDMASHRLLEPEDKSVEAVRILFFHRCDSTDSPRYGNEQSIRKRFPYQRGLHRQIPVFYDRKINEVVSWFDGFFTDKARPDAEKSDSGTPP
jgi:hypothetical protein